MFHNQIKYIKYITKRYLSIMSSNGNDGNNYIDSDTDSDSDELNEQEQLDFFKEAVKKYLKLDDEISKLNKAVKERRKQKNNLSETIITYLKSKDISEINLQDRQLICGSSKRSSSLSKNNINSALEKYFQNSKEAKKVIDFIIAERTVVYKPKLKLKKIKKSYNKFNSSNSSNNNINSINNDNIPEHLRYLYTNVVEDK
tara:strand:- start:48 stop:647 length:600 start_codon:yes stop_codon:yes gene_type:complete